jgi:hypothetical protein
MRFPMEIPKDKVLELLRPGLLAKFDIDPQDLLATREETR